TMTLSSSLDRQTVHHQTLTASHLMSVEVCGHTCEWEESHLWLLCPGSATDGCCALNWDPFGKSCYFFSNVAMTWDEAQDWCTGHESHLPHPVSLLQDFVVKHSAGTWYWVGLTDRTGKWEWVNHTPYVMDRRRWRPGQPDSWTGHGLGHGDEDCGQLHSDGRLNDLHCLTQLPPPLRDQAPPHAAKPRPPPVMGGTANKQFRTTQILFFTIQ
uniref:C-type lectin domain-containing protein n=1 Tax=Takifugu rubripes TaxID=31033 RepID=H2RPI1_TAKRU